MKRREDGKRERGDRIQPESFASDVAVRAGDFHCFRLFEPPAAHRAREIHRVVALPFLVDRRGYRLGDVPLLAVRERNFAVELIENFCGCYCPLANSTRSMKHRIGKSFSPMLAQLYEISCVAVATDPKSGQLLPSG